VMGWVARLGWQSGADRGGGGEDAEGKQVPGPLLRGSQIHTCLGRAVCRLGPERAGMDANDGRMS
jgi:hypothetical protein